MLDWLDRQRQKPKAARARVALFIAIVVTAFVALLWVLTIPVRLGSINLMPAADVENGTSQPMFNEIHTTIDEGRNTVERAIIDARNTDSAGSTTTAATTTPENPFPTTAPSTTPSTTP